MKSNRFTALVAAVLTASVLVSCSSGNLPSSDTGNETDNETPISEKIEKTYAADSLLTDGKLGNDEDGELTVGFIGGSLTALTAGMCYFDAVGRQVSCGNPWALDLCHYFEEKFPNKTVKGVNAAVGGTGSDYGAYRFERFVLEYEPDIVFIDFAVNDTGRDRENTQKYMERMVNMCRNADKVPVVIFLFMPYPTDENSATMIKWKDGVEAKSEIADLYEIGYINIYDYLYKTFEKSEYDDINDFLDLYYEGSAGNFNVHGGYELYYDCIVEAFENNPSDYICRIGDTEEEAYPLGNCTYKIISSRDERLKYDGSWKFYDRSNIYDYDDYSLEEQNFSYPFALDGVTESLNVGDTVTFTTDAAELCFYTIFSDTGGYAEVSVDGVVVGKANCYSTYYCWSNAGSFVTLPDDGQNHEVKVTVCRGEYGTRYRIANIAEIYHAK